MILRLTAVDEMLRSALRGGSVETVADWSVEARYGVWSGRLRHSQMSPAFGQEHAWEPLIERQRPSSAPQKRRSDGHRTPAVRGTGCA